MRFKWLYWAMASLTVSTLGGCSGKKPLVGASQAETPRVQAPPPAPARPAPAAPAPVSLSEEEWFRTASVEELQRRLQDVFFEYDSSALPPEARNVIEHNAAWLRQPYNTAVIELEGHCDERGTAEYNLALGDRRSSSTREYLVSLGVPRERVRTISYGKERPVCSSGAESCWSRNRRAHFRIASKASPTNRLAGGLHRQDPP